MAKLCTHLIHVTNRPAISNRVLDWYVASLEVTPAPRRVIGCPVIIHAPVESSVVVLREVSNWFMKLRQSF
jgi:hypothetical protein